MGAGVAKVKEKKEGGGGREGSWGGGDMRAIIIISKSIQIKVVPLYSQVWFNKILRPCPFLSTAQEHRHRHKTPTQDTSFYLFSFICTHFISRHSTPECFIQICVNVTLTMRPFFTLARIFPFELHTDIVAECSLAFLNTW